MLAQKKLIPAMILALAAGACGAPKVNLFPDRSEPLREYTLEGSGRRKVALIPVRGTISDAPQKGLLGSRPSLVQEVVARLKAAEKDPSVRAVVLKINSPGGTVTASDILYREIVAFKERSGASVVAALMQTATSGAYYTALSADSIYAHPTTITGSAGVIFLRPKVRGLFDKIGLDVEVSKSGSLKDMGSPFRRTSEEEERLLQEMIDTLAERFLNLVAERRNLDKDSLGKIATARIFLAAEALDHGLIDEIGYLDEAVARARSLAGLAEDARVVVYRRQDYPDDTLYNSMSLQKGPGALKLIDIDPAGALRGLDAGFHYLWLPARGGG